MKIFIEIPFDLIEIVGHILDRAYRKRRIHLAHDLHRPENCSVVSLAEVDMIIVRPEEVVEHHAVACIVVASSVILAELLKILSAQLMKLYIHILLFFPF